MNYKSISTTILQKELNDPALAIVDLRPSAAFNGWRLQQEARGGHLPAAISFALPWRNSLADGQLEVLLKAKGITAEKKIVLYGCSAEDCKSFAGTLQGLGIANLWILEGGIQRWAADPSLPMERLPRYEKLVYPGWIAAAGRTPGNFKLFEASWNDDENYREAHLPGAYHLDLSQFEDHATYNLVPYPDLIARLQADGITAGETTVIYGKDLLAAFRAAWMLMVAGVKDVRVLDGGFDGWINAGLPVEKGSRNPVPVNHFGTKIPGHPEYHRDIDAVRELTAAPNRLLVCVRSWEEYTGKTSGYHFIQATGRIPGSVWGISGQAAHEMSLYRNPDNSMRSYLEIAAGWRKQGITPDKEITFYCGTGWRASEAFFYGYLMGWPNISVYDGGWHQWSQEKANPIETGNPQTKPRIGGQR